VPLDIIKVFCLPTDAQEFCFKKILKFTLKCSEMFWFNHHHSHIPNSLIATVLFQTVFFQTVLFQTVLFQIVLFQTVSQTYTN